MKGPDFRAVRGMDPAANWLLGIGVDDYLTAEDVDKARIPFLIELSADAVEPFKQLVREREGATVLGVDLSNEPIDKDILIPIVATQAWLLNLLDGKDEVAARFRVATKRIAFSTPLVGVSKEGLEQAPRSLPQRLFEAPQDGVVVAAIDDGFAFAHERFQGKNGPRIEAFWDMNGPLPESMPPDGELTRGDIAALIETATSPGGVDEDAVYRAAGLLDYADARHKPLAWRVSHGTHVLDLAAGADPGADGRPIIAVQLPSPVVARTTGEMLDLYVWLAALYIRNRAGARPVVINISFGYDAGPHDGKGLLEKHLSLLAAKADRKTVVVLAAGNAQLSRCHAVVHPKKTGPNGEAMDPIEIDWIVQPEDRTHSVVEIWLPSEDKPGQRLKLTVVLPDGTDFEIAEPLPPDEALPQVALLHLGRKMGLVELWERPEDGRRMFRIAIGPTARPEPDSGILAPAGRWTLRFAAGKNALTEPVHAWVQRDDSLYGYPQRGRQSYFDHEDYVRFDDHGYEMDDDPPARPCPITRRSLLNAIATSEHVVVAGGYRSRDGRIARYSCGGPNVSPPEPAGRLKPDALLPSDGSPAHPGVLAAGARSGARVAMDGTSVAAPQLARYLADRLKKQEDPGRPAVQAAVQADPGRPAVQAAVQTHGVASQPSNSSGRGGHGRLERLDPPLAERFEPGD